MRPLYPPQQVLLPRRRHRCCSHSRQFFHVNQCADAFSVPEPAAAAAAASVAPRSLIAVTTFQSQLLVSSRHAGDAAAAAADRPARRPIWLPHALPRPRAPATNRTAVAVHRVKILCCLLTVYSSVCPSVGFRALHSILRPFAAPILCRPLPSAWTKRTPSHILALRFVLFIFCLFQGG